MFLGGMRRYLFEAPMDITSEVVGQFIKQGFLGSLLLLAIFALYRLLRKYDEVQEKRIKEGLESQKLIAALTQAVKRSIRDRQ